MTIVRRGPLTWRRIEVDYEKKFVIVDQYRAYRFISATIQVSNYQTPIGTRAIYLYGPT